MHNAYIQYATQYIIHSQYTKQHTIFHKCTVEHSIHNLDFFPYSDFFLIIQFIVS